ncbi:MAG: hypothetical protein K0R67_1688 [Paenibacillus sp.]|nr:hypothetical protein [Paenibacillus sp.]
MQKQLTSLGQWLHSWIRPDGSINGFNNHSVWGGNPYRWLDFHSGHSTWSSPMMPALAHLLADGQDEYGQQTLRNMASFQATSFQNTGQYRYIGFETGETSRNALIHNAVTNVSLALTALLAAPILGEAIVEQIRQAILNNMEACRHFGGGRAGEKSTCNQEYTRLWSKMLFREAFQDNRWDDEIIEDLDYMLEHFHAWNVPDADCAGTLRYLGDKEALEPAEYYGLMIAPLTMASTIFGQQRYADAARAICLHVARSSWVDHEGQRRFHRLWYRQDGQWRVMKEPMLIAGMGFTLYGIHQYLQLEDHAELQAFLTDCDRTYAHYQTEGGYFVSASGWSHEANVVPSTSWHAHDFMYLAVRHRLPDAFWEEWRQPTPKTVLLGDDVMWMENGEHWSIGDYYWQDIYKLLGKKSSTTFYRSIPEWTGSDRVPPKTMEFPDKPVLLKTDEGIYLRSEHNVPYGIRSVSRLPYLGRG